MKPEELAKHELIGLKVRVAGSRNESQKGIEGTVIDETKNMLVISSQAGEKKVFKEQSIFIFTLQTGEEVTLEGERISGRSEDRLKKKWSKKRW